MKKGQELVVAMPAWKATDVAAIGEAIGRTTIENYELMTEILKLDPKAFSRSLEALGEDAAECIESRPRSDYPQEPFEGLAGGVEDFVGSLRMLRRRCMPWDIAC